MARVTVEEVAAWGERTKLRMDTLDVALLEQMETEVLARLSGQLDTTTWVDVDTTPSLIRTIIAKKFFALFYWRQYSEDVGTDENTYANKVDANAEMLIMGILDGSIIVTPGAPDEISQPSFYPNDASSSLDPRDYPDDPSVGPNRFSINQVF